MTHRSTCAAALVPLALLAASAYGIGTPAGTTITNQAEVTFSMGGALRTQMSNVAALNVAEVVDVNLVVQTPQVLVYGGAAAQPVRITLSNVGNGSEFFSLIARHSLAGDDFDPTAGVPTIYFDSDGDGSLGAADQAYIAGVNDPALLPDQSVSVFVISDIPAGVSDGDVGRVEMTARAISGAGTPGQSLAGLGDGGVDAVIGASGGSANGEAEYRVGQVDLIVSKSAIVRDPSGGNLPVAGAAIDYLVQVSAVGSGSAADAVFLDIVPVGTRYVSGSIRANGVALTDAPDADGGLFEAATGTVRVDLGTIAPSDPAQQLNFTVMID